MVASEAAPFCKTGGLADVLGALPAALRERGDDVRVVLPAYRINRYNTPPREVWRNLWVPLGAGGVLCDIYESTEGGVPFYFVDCPALYDRDGIYASPFGDFPDNHYRFAALSSAAIGVARHVFRPEIFHCHDWQTALLPLYLRDNFRNDPTFWGTRCVFTIHNLGYQGEFGGDVLYWIGIDRRLFNPDEIEFYGKVNFMKAGIHFSDSVTTVSPRYAQEIQTPEFGFSLDGYLREQNKLTGILNGVDYNEWNPETDPHIARNYSAQDLTGKRECKRALLAEFGFPESVIDRPLIGIVSRFADQKGFDLVGDVGEWLLGYNNITFIVLGSGEQRYEDMFNYFAAAHSDKARAWIGYNDGVSHRIEAGADIFLMPSRYEPCGLNQMYSLKYGTLPLVRATGGLDDTIEDGTGFKFWHYDGGSLRGALQYALDAWRDQDNWTSMMRRAMQKDYSWSVSAGQYSQLYQRLLGR
jgi:starch synthase